MESKDGSGCGDFRGLTPYHLFLNVAMTAHLKRFHLPNEDVLEYQLFLARAGCFCLREEKVAEMFVCPKQVVTITTI